MSEHTPESGISRRAMLGTMGNAAAASVVLPSVFRAAILRPYEAGVAAAPVNGVAGVDRVVVLPGKTYLRAWAGYGEPPRPTPPSELFAELVLDRGEATEKPDAPRNLEQHRVGRREAHRGRQPLCPCGQRLETRPFAANRTLEYSQRCGERERRVQLDAGHDAATARGSIGRDDVDLAMHRLDDHRRPVRRPAPEHVECQIRQIHSDPRLARRKRGLAIEARDGDGFPNGEIARG